MHLHPDRVRPPPAAAAASSSYSSSRNQYPASYGVTMGGPSVNDDNLEDPPRALSPAMDMALSYQRRRQHPGSLVLPSEAAARRQSDPAGGGNYNIDAEMLLSGGGPLAVDVYGQSLLSQSYNTAERFFQFSTPNASSLSPTRRRMEAAAQLPPPHKATPGGAGVLRSRPMTTSIPGSASGTATPLTSNLALLLASQKSESGANNMNTAGDGTKEELGIPTLGVAGDDSVDANGPTSRSSGDIDDDEGYALGLGANQHTPRPGDPILKRSHHTYSPESDSASVATTAAAASLQEPSVGSGSSVSFAPTTQEMLPRRPPPVLGSSAPGRFLLPPGAAKNVVRDRKPLPTPRTMTSIPARATSASAQGAGTSRSADSALLADDTVRRCQSVYEMRRGMSSSHGGTTSSTPAYSDILQKKKSIEATLQERLSQRREASMKELLQVQDQMRRLSTQSSRPLSPIGDELGHSQSSHSSSTLRMTNNRRKCRRAEHNRAVINDLCEIVADLFVAESKLLLHSAHATTASSAGFAGLLDGTSPDRGSVLSAVSSYLAELPVRYALGVDSPSEVLLHMRLMTAARADPTKAAVHIANVDDGDSHVAAGTIRPGSTLRLVTICCADSDGLLEFITRLLGTGGARVLDADVMLTSDSIALDRFVVEMQGRLRLDKLQQYVESYLQEARDQANAVGAMVDNDEKRAGNAATTSRPPKASESAPVLPSFPSQPKLRPRAGSISAVAYGPVYFHPRAQQGFTPRRLQEEIQSAVPLSRLLSSTSVGTHHGRRTSRNEQTSHAERPEISQSSEPLPYRPTSSQSSDSPKTSGQSTGEDSSSRSPPTPPATPLQPAANMRRRSHSDTGGAYRQRQMLVNREAAEFTNSPEHGTAALPEDDVSNGPIPPSGITVALESQQARRGRDRTVPLIPLNELMLIETLGTGRVSTIYRAAWQMPQRSESPAIVALKVATTDPNTGDASCIEELHHEADIAAQLEHKNICRLMGVASDPECFCLAYEYCEGGSLLSLLSDTSRYYEYLPIALDIANGMAYLHSRAILHRDLKPSNVLLTKRNRAKISDFGMSVAMTGQELTAETGTYRWMSPEVIRHEPYSSNADVYSFGVVLWQLITREVPFATMTPIQTAYAVAEGHRPEIPTTVPEPLRHIIEACWHEDQSQRPSFTYIAMALADYAKLAFNPNAVGAQTVEIANEIIGSVQGNSTVNVDLSVGIDHRRHSSLGMSSRVDSSPGGRGHWFGPSSYSSGGTGGGNIGLEI